MQSYLVTYLAFLLLIHRVLINAYLYNLYRTLIKTALHSKYQWEWISS